MKQSIHTKPAGAKSDALRTVLTLLVVCVLAAGVLTVVQRLTRDRITAHVREETETALRRVVDQPDDSRFTRVQATAAQLSAAAEYDAVLDAVYAVQTGGENSGSVFQMTSAGVQGDLVLMVGVDEDGAVSGVFLFSSSEPAISGVTQSDLLPNGIGVLDQFIGKKAADLPLTIGVNVEAVSGAAASCETITQGVNGALAAAGTVG